MPRQRAVARRFSPRPAAGCAGARCQPGSRSHRRRGLLALVFVVAGSRSSRRAYL